MELANNFEKTVELVSHSDSTGMAHIMIFCCFAFMVWQSWLQYKKDSKNDVEIANIKQRFEKNEETIRRLFEKVDEISANLAHIGGIIDNKILDGKLSK